MTEIKQIPNYNEGSETLESNIITYKLNVEDEISNIIQTKEYEYKNNIRFVRRKINPKIE